MVANTKIEWCTHTFNPWVGCQKCSPACAHCYAEAWAKRAGRDFSTRTRTKDATWNEPLKWNREAEAAGTTATVFCASLADVFEHHKDINFRWREELWFLIRETPHLTWLLLTKRPENISRFFPFDCGPPKNVVFGITTENQDHFLRRWHHLRQIKARGYRTFISAEPLLGPLSLDLADHPDWVITGGESGGQARPTNPAWVRDLRDQCKLARIPFMHKHWGEWAPADNWPSEIQEHYDARGRTSDASIRVGKSKSGRQLDGTEHLAALFPVSPQSAQKL